MTIKSNLERANSIVSSSQIKYENSEGTKMTLSKMNKSGGPTSMESPKDELIRVIKEKGSVRKRIHQYLVIYYKIN